MRTGHYTNYRFALSAYTSQTTMHTTAIPEKMAMSVNETSNL